MAPALPSGGGLLNTTGKSRTIGRQGEPGMFNWDNEFRYPTLAGVERTRGENERASRKSTAAGKLTGSGTTPLSLPLDKISQQKARRVPGVMTERGRRSSRTLERQYRDFTNRYDGTMNVTTDVGREPGRGGSRWLQIDYAWDEVTRRKKGRTVPQSAAPVTTRPPFPSTRDFHTDSIYSPVRKQRPPQCHEPAIKGPPDNRWGKEKLRESEAGRHGEWEHWKGGRDAVPRPSTAGIRSIPWNHHWQR